MGKCKDCNDWSRDKNKGGELDSSSMYDEVDAPTFHEKGYGRCEAAKDGAPMVAKYDGGYTGELLTHGDFGCNQFKAK